MHDANRLAQVPVLVIHGDRDMLVDCSQGMGKLDLCSLLADTKHCTIERSLQMGALPWRSQSRLILIAGS